MSLSQFSSGGSPIRYSYLLLVMIFVTLVRILIMKLYVTQLMSYNLISFVIVNNCNKYMYAHLQITTIDEAKQFYPLFGLGANIALVFSGRTVKYFSHLRSNLPDNVDGWGFSLKGMMSLVVVLGFVICGIHWWVNKYVVNDPSLPKAEVRKKVSVPIIRTLPLMIVKLCNTITRHLSSCSSIIRLIFAEGKTKTWYD